MDVARQDAPPAAALRAAAPPRAQVRGTGLCVREPWRARGSRTAPLRHAPAQPPAQASPPLVVAGACRVKRALPTCVPDTRAAPLCVVSARRPSRGVHAGLSCARRVLGGSSRSWPARMKTRFCVDSGLRAHFGSENAASMSKNSPSASHTLRRWRCERAVGVNPARGEHTRAWLQGVAARA